MNCGLCVRYVAEPPGHLSLLAKRDGGPMTGSNVSKMMAAASKRAGLPYANPHMLRHTCGHLLADAGHDTSPSKTFGSEGATMETTLLTARELAAQLRLRGAVATLAKQQAIRRVKQQVAAKIMD